MASSRISRADDNTALIPALIATTLVFILYLITLAPSVAMWDTGEYMAAVKVLGIPHPPGNPFFMLLGHAFALLPIPVSYAARVNILAALASACSAGLWFLIIERITARWIDLRWQRLVIASVGTIIGATAFTVWNQAVVNEKVYPVSLLFVTVISWLTVKWIDDPDSPRSGKFLPQPKRIIVRTRKRRNHSCPIQYRDSEWTGITSAAGPDRVSGGQWTEPYAREYFRCVTEHGTLVWLFRDAREDEWYLHGWWD